MTVVLIEHSAAPVRSGGWAPVYRTSGGRWFGHTHRGTSLVEALSAAEDMAQDEAARFVGDWTVRVARVPVLQEVPR